MAVPNARAQGAYRAQALTLAPTRRPAVTPVTIESMPPGIAIAPSHQDADLQNQRPEDFYRLASGLDGVVDHRGKPFDVVLIDCPPSSGSVTINALVAADRALIVSEPAADSVESVGETVATIATTARGLNPQIAALGIVLNKVDGRRPVDQRQWIAAAREDYGDLIFKTSIPLLQAIPRAKTEGATLRAQGRRGAVARTVYDQLASEFLERI